MLKNKPVYQDVMVLNQGHSIMANTVPTNIVVGDAISHYEALPRATCDVSSFGLYGSGLNYNTFYKDVKPEDIQPVDEDFIEPMFRLLSACIVAKNHNPTDFSTPGLLKNSMNLLRGQTVNCDHETDVGNAIGVIKSVEWQEEFTQDGITVPAGIVGILKIDAKSNPRIARGVMMDPPSIHSNSVTVTFRWTPSHTFDTSWEFYEKLGTYDDKGEMVRRIVTEIVSYSETSLVSHGADPFAQKIADGKLNHIAYAAKSYYGTMENKETLIKEIPTRVFNNLDYRDMYQGTLVATGIGVIENSETDSLFTTVKDENSHLIDNKNNTMEKNLINVEDLFSQDHLSLKEGETPTLELAQKQIVVMLKELEDLRSLKAMYENVDLESLKNKATLAESYIEKVRTEAIESYTKLQGPNSPLDENIITLLNSSELPVATLESLGEGYKKQLEQAYPLSCSKCGSKQVDRSSSVENDEEGETETHQHQESHVSIHDTITQLTEQKIQ